MSDGVSTNEKPGEIEWAPQNFGGRRNRLESVHSKSTARERGCKAPENRELKFAFSLAEIFGINKHISGAHVITFGVIFHQVWEGEDTDASEA